jgi:hypothetical protein
LKKGFGWFGSEQTLKGSDYAIDIHPYKWTPSNLYKDYLVGDANIIGNNLLGLFSANKIIENEEEIFEILSNELSKKQITVVDIEYKIENDAKRTFIRRLGKTIPKGDKTNSEFLQEIIEGVYEIKSIQEEILRIAKMAENGPEFSQEVEKLDREVGHYGELLDRTLKEEEYYEEILAKTSGDLSGLKKEEALKYYQSLFSDIRAERK